MWVLAEMSKFGNQNGPLAEGRGLARRYVGANINGTIAGRTCPAFSAGQHHCTGQVGEASLPSL